MSRELRFHDEALAEIRSAAGWYDERRQGLGNEFLEALEVPIKQLAASPNLGGRDGGRGARGTSGPAVPCFLPRQEPETACAALQPPATTKGLLCGLLGMKMAPLDSSRDALGLALGGGAGNRLELHEVHAVDGVQGEQMTGAKQEGRAASAVPPFEHWWRRRESNLGRGGPAGTMSHGEKRTKCRSLRRRRDLAIGPSRTMAGGDGQVAWHGRVTVRTPPVRGSPGVRAALFGALDPREPAGANRLLDHLLDA